MKLNTNKYKKCALDTLEPGDLFLFERRYMLKTKHHLPNCTTLCVDVQTGDYIYLEDITAIVSSDAEVTIL